MRTNPLLIFIVLLALVSLTTLIGRADSVKVLKDNHPSEALMRQAVGNADSDQPLTMQVRFALRNAAELEELLKEQQDPASANYHKWLKTGEFDQRFGPRLEDVEAVAKWLASEGFAVQPTADGHVEFSGDVALAQHSFAVRIARYDDGATYANVDDPAIPAQFAGTISAITGLDNMAQITPLEQHRAALTPFAIVNGIQSFGPQDVSTFYDETVSASSGSGECIAIVGVSDVSPNALSAFTSQFGLPAIKVTKVLQGKNPGRSGQSSEREAELDLEWSHAVAPGATQKFFLSANTNTGLASDIAKAVNDNTCGVISISFGYCGGTPTTEFTKVLDPQFKKAAAQGQSVFVSSGDQGAAGLTSACKASTSRGVSEMSADPNVTAVGGTEAFPTFNNGNVIGYSQEDTWNNSNQGLGATGGGVSTIFPKPSYQTGPGVPSDVNRDVPDIALLASPINPGVFFGDASMTSPPAVVCCIGGTSLSAPMMAGFVSVIDQQLGGRLGNMNPIYYQLANRQYGPDGVNEGFHDITIGNNNFDGVLGFSAGAAYDQTTGEGSFDFDVFAAAVKSLPIPTPTPGALTAPTSVTFNQKVVKTYPAKSIKLTNTKPKTVQATVTSVALQVGSVYKIVSDGCTTTPIPPRKSCIVTVQFIPTATGKGQDDTLIFTDNAPNSPQKVTLKGNGS